MSAATVSYAEVLVQRLATWPFVRIERRGARAVLTSGGRDLPIGTIDLRDELLTVAVPPALVGPVLARHPELEPGGRGVRLALTDPGRLAVGETLLRWRVGRVRFAAQRREASP
jgi:hypothetical protein